MPGKTKAASAAPATPVAPVALARPMLDPERDFTYHPPTSETGPKFTALREAEVQASDRVHNGATSGDFEAISLATMAFAKVILEVAPAGPRQTLAYRKVEAARMLANEAVVLYLERRIAPGAKLLDKALTALVEARHCASAAVALA